MMLPFSFQKGNKAAGCEDAPPVSNIKFSVVCDGLGGAGSTKHKVEEAGTVVMRTSGYLGSRVVADSVTDFYDVNYERIANILFSNGNSVIALQAVIEELKSTIKTALSTKMTKLGIDPMLTRKKALKIFPTTLASALYFQDTKVVFDDGKDDDFRRCHYTPNVTMLNSCLVEWSESGIEFYGLFHTHFYGVSSLSKGDALL